VEKLGLQIVYPAAVPKPCCDTALRFQLADLLHIRDSLAVPKGSKLEAVAHYDNSANNNSNPDPTIEVHWGEQTWDEMQYTGINYTIDDESPKQPNSDY